MRTSEWIDRLNEISKPTADDTKPIKPGDLFSFLKSARKAPKRRDLTIFIEAITPIVNAFSSASVEDRRAISSALSRDASRYLLSFAYRMAEEAIPQASPELMRAGLIALTMGPVDVREAIVRMALLFHSGSKLGVDTPGLFFDVSAMAAFEPLARRL